MATLLSDPTLPPNGAPPAPPRVSPPSPPETLADTGLSAGFVADLLLKILYAQGARTGAQITDAIGLPFLLVDEQINGLQQQRLVEVRGTSGSGRAKYRFDLTAAGRVRAQEAFLGSHYGGCAPVPLEQCRAQAEAQTIRHFRINCARIREGFADVVLEREMLDLLGPAINSAKSLFLYGESGNGKTLIAETIASLMGGAIYLPHAVLVEGQIISVFDPVHHRLAGEEDTTAERPAWLGAEGDAAGAEVERPAAWLKPAASYDRRFARVRRPVVLTGGEVTLDQLDLQYDHHAHVYQAPFQAKANGGILIIDDFGRQRVPARDLLNRWIVPLEKRLDYLTLHTGTKFPIPFDCLLIFATNLEIRSLIEEAFLRRIHYKIYVGAPTRPQWEEIFRRCCHAKEITFSRHAVDYVYREFYDRGAVAPRCCHPRDLLDHLRDAATFLELEPSLSYELLDRACNSYFLSWEDGTLTTPGRQ
ncbi:MAG: ATP-binding protein [Gemmatimonadetes bacterium]|jgi:predicted ATPase with chaperone activity|nr:ATP-binding protein [Gemmatimonadota bacterium]